MTKEANELTEAAFAERHPGPAVVSEPLGQAGAGEAGAGKKEISPSARICWPEMKDQPRIRIGRSDTWARIALPHPRVSKEHLTLALVGSGRWGVMDHGSTNGTFVQGKRIAPHALVEIADGEPLELGDAIRLRVYKDAAALRAALGSNEPAPAPVVCRDELPRLASVLRSLGFEADCIESEGDVRVQNAGDEIRVRVRGSAYLVECNRGGLCLKSDTTPTYGKDAEAALRDLVLKHLGFGKESDPRHKTDAGIDLSRNKTRTD